MRLSILPKIKKYFIFLIVLLLCYPVIPAMASQNNTIRVGWFEQEGYQETLPEGKRYGYNYEYYYTLSQYTGWQYEFVDGTFSELYQKLQTGDIDLLGCVYFTQERAEEIGFSSISQGTSHQSLIVSQACSSYYLELSSLEGSSIGVLDDYSKTSLESFLDSYQINATVLIYDNLTQLYNDISHRIINAGAIDCYIDNPDYKVVAQYDFQNLYFCTNQENKELLSTLNDSLSRIKLNNHDIDRELTEKYLSYRYSSFSLTDEEQDYIASCDTLRVLCDESWKPLIDYHKKNHECEGIIGDVYARISKLTGLEFEFVHGDENKLPDDIDLLACCVQDFDSDSDFAPTGQLLMIPLTIITNPNVKSANSLVATATRYESLCPHIDNTSTQFVLYDTEQECLNALLHGECKQAIIHSYSASYYLSQNKYSTLCKEIFDTHSLAVAVGVSRDQDQRLYHIMDKAVDYLRYHQIDEIVTDNTLKVQNDTLLNWIQRSPSERSLFVILLLISALTLISYTIFKSRSTKLRRLQANEFSLFMTYVCRVSDIVYELDIKSRTAFQYQLIQHELVKTPIEYLDSSWVKLHVLPMDWNTAFQVCNPMVLNEMIHTNEEQQMECRIRMKTDEQNSFGPYLWYHCSLQGISPSRIHPYSILISLNNIENVKRSEIELQSQITALTEKEEKRGDAEIAFINHISYKIKTPLTALMGYVTLAIQDLKGDNEENIAYLQNANLLTHELNHVIMNLLDFTHLVNDNLTLSISTFKLSVVLSSVIDYYSKFAVINQTEFTVHNDTDVNLFIQGDPMRIRQILMNLLDNAFQSCHKDGNIIFTVMSDPSSANENGHEFTFTVMDNGNGYSEIVSERLFSTSSYSTFRNTSSGMGLSIIRGLVAKMNGSIALSGKPGSGTSISVSLPLTICDYDKASDIHPDNRNLNLSGLHILYAEDNEMNAEITIAILERQGIIVTRVRDGKEAVDTYMESPSGTYSLIIMDIVMPVMDGITASKEIRASSPNDAKTIPIIALTADTFEQEKIPLTESGLNGFLYKPINVAQLYQVIAFFTDRI